MQCTTILFSLSSLFCFCIFLFLSLSLPSFFSLLLFVSHSTLVSVLTLLRSTLSLLATCPPPPPLLHSPSTDKGRRQSYPLAMSHSRVNNDSSDLEHLELEIATTDSPVPETPATPSYPADPRRVSINSLDSTSSNATIKYQHQPTPSEPVSSSYGRPSAIRMPSTASAASVPGSRRPKSTGSYRNSTAGPPSSSSSTGYRRRPQQLRRTASTRSSIRRNNRSSDIEEEDESSNDISDEHLAESRSNYSNMRRANSRRSVRVNPEDEYDGRDYEGQDRHSIDYNMDEEEEDESDIEPLTLKDRQEVGRSRDFLSDTMSLLGLFFRLSFFLFILALLATCLSPLFW